MNDPQCLNCGTAITGKYCAACGQKGSTGRITPGHFLMHDLMHGMWHIERGLFYTAGRALTRPGKMAADYIAGKRVKYYNFFYLLLLVIGFNALVTHWFEDFYKIADQPTTTKGDDADSIDVTYFIDHYFKLLVFLIIPFFSFNGWLVFKKAKLNIAEHAILAANILLSGSMWYFMFNLYYYFTYRVEWKILDYINLGMFVFIGLLPAIAYWQLGNRIFTKGSYMLRMALWYLLALIELSLILLMVVYFTGKTSIILN